MYLTCEPSCSALASLALWWMLTCSPCKRTVSIPGGWACAVWGLTAGWTVWGTLGRCALDACCGPPWRAYWERTLSWRWTRSQHSATARTFHEPVRSVKIFWYFHTTSLSGVMGEGGARAVRAPQYLEQQKQVRFVQTNNQVLCQLLLHPEEITKKDCKRTSLGCLQRLTFIWNFW